MTLRTHALSRRRPVATSNTSASSRLGFVVIEQGRKAESEQLLRRAINLNP